MDRGQVECAEPFIKGVSEIKQLPTCGPHKQSSTSAPEQRTVARLLGAAGRPSQLARSGPAQTVHWPRSEADLQGG